MASLTQRALDLVLEFEVSGKAGYEAKYKHPIWPQEASGITIGIGYDLGYVSKEKFKSDFAALNATTKASLSAVCGLTGTAARDKLASVKNNTIEWAVAIDVFQRTSVPDYFRTLERAMPGTSNLNPEIQGALWSLVYNRGASMTDTDRRREMRQIRDAVRNDNLELIPGLIRSMIRLWVGTPIENGMRRRREAEAKLVEIGLAETSFPGGAAEIHQPQASNRILRFGDRGMDVEELQRALQSLALYQGRIDGDFGPLTLAAVKKFQLQAGLDIDGEVGPLTWEALGADAIEPVAIVVGTIQEKREKMAEIASREGALGLKWVNANSKAEKYLQPLRKPMQDLGHIGSAPVFYNWCAAFVAFCAREAGFNVPDVPPGLGVTVALAEAWRKWGKNTGTYVRRQDTTPKRGDIAVFEWSDGDSQIDHIGIVTKYDPGS